MDNKKLQDNNIKRRSFLKTASFVMGATALGSIGWSLLRGSTPIDDLKKPAFSFNLNEIPIGESIIFKHQGKPIVIRHLTDKQLSKAKEQDKENYRETSANNANFIENSIASNANRFATEDMRYLILDPSCTRLACVTIFNKGDYDGWFCPCSGAHYDIAGRVRKGPAPRNLRIPRYEIDKTKTVHFYSNPKSPSLDKIEKLIKS